MRIYRRAGRLLLISLLFFAALSADSKKEDQHIRSVQGVVRNGEDQALDGAVVQLKNTKTLQILSFITRDHGNYVFHGLSTDVDYELRADYQGMSSKSKTLSTYDTRKAAVVNLKIEEKK